jgi:single-strand DNA-binding protein
MVHYIFCLSLLWVTPCHSFSVLPPTGRPFDFVHLPMLSFGIHSRPFQNPCTATIERQYSRVQNTLVGTLSSSNVPWDESSSDEFVNEPIWTGNLDEIDEEDTVMDEELDATLGDWDDKVARFNTIHVSGRVGNDPEPRYFDDGKVVVNINLASARKYVIQERLCRDIKYGEEETDWYGLEIWGQTAEFVSKYVDKGMRISVIGTLQIDEWSDPETGEMRCKAKVIVREVDLLESRVETEQRRSKRSGSSSFSEEGPSDDVYYGKRLGSSDSFF